MYQNQNMPWLTACTELSAAVDVLHDYRRMSEEEFTAAHALACVHLNRANQALQALVEEQSSADTASFYDNCVNQLRQWIAPVLEGNRSQFRLIAIRDATRLWLPDRRRLERERSIEAA